MTLSAIVTAILAAYGVSTTRFRTFLSGVMDTLSVPEERQAEIEAWLQTNANVSPERAKALATLIFTEIASGAPGYDPEHGGGA